VDNEAARQKFLATNKVVIEKSQSVSPALEVKINYPNAPQTKGVTHYNTPYNASGEFDLDGEAVRQQYQQNNYYYTKK
jgi:hypothetical protein